MPVFCCQTKGTLLLVGEVAWPTTWVVVVEGVGEGVFHGSAGWE